MNVKNYLSLFKTFQKFDKKVAKRVKSLNQNSFVRLWITQKDYLKHLKKRLKKKDIANRSEYFTKTLATYYKPQNIYYLKALSPQTVDKILFISSNWVDIFSEDGRLITSFPLKISLKNLLNDPKNRTYKAIPIPLAYHSSYTLKNLQH